MKTAADRIRFAVRFATFPLDTFRPGDWLNLRDDVARFIDPGDVATGSIGVSAHAPINMPRSYFDSEDERLPANDAKRLQFEVRGVLERVADAYAGKGAAKPDAVVTHIGFLRTHVEMSIYPPGVVGPGSVLVMRGRSTADVFAAVLMHLLAGERKFPIRRCPDCGAIFFKVRRQVYCSRRCVNRVNMQAHLEREANRAKKRTRQQQAYDARTPTGQRQRAELRKQRALKGASHGKTTRKG